MGGSLGIYECDSDIAIGITVNKLTLEREFTRTVLNHIAQETGTGLMIEME